MAKREGPPRPVAVKDVLAGFLRPGDWEILRQRQLIRQIWDREIPASLAAQSRLVDLRRRELWVEVSNSPVIQELMFLKPKILAELEVALGAGVIRDIKFVVGAEANPGKSRSFAKS